MEKKFKTVVYLDSYALYNHLMKFEGAEDESNKDEFVVILSYKNTDDLVNFIDHVRSYFEGRFYENLEDRKWDEHNILCWIFDHPNEGDEEEVKIVENAFNYFMKLYK